MAAAALPQLSSMLGGAPPRSTPSSGTTPSSQSSTPVTLLGAGCQPFVHYMQPTGHYGQLPSILPQMPLPPPPPPVTSVFEGVPIFLVPQSGANTVSFAAFQRAAEIKACRPSRSQSPKVDTSKHFHVFVGDLAADVDNSTLKIAFKKFGEISEAKVIRDPQTLKSKGYGFVTFPIKENAEKAIEAMNGQLIGRRQIRTNWATRRPNGGDDATAKLQTFEEVFNATHVDNTSVYVGNISSNTSESDLLEAFSVIGNVNEIRLFKQQGYAFVRYVTKEAAARAILTMNGKEISEQKIRCSWGKTPTDSNCAANQALGNLSLLTTNILGMNPLVNPVAWNQSQCLSQLYGQPLLHTWQA